MVVGNKLKKTSALTIEDVVMDESSTPEVKSRKRGGKSRAEQEKATVNITLNDCLACSGCVTSAETILIQQQSHKELISVISQNKVRIKVVSIFCCFGL